MPGADWTGVAPEAGDIVVATPKGPMRFDFLIAGTGLSYGIGARPELASFEPDVATWADRFTPPEAETDAYLAAAPYPRPRVRIHREAPRDGAPSPPVSINFTYGATLSMGLSAASISGMRYGVPG